MDGYISLKLQLLSVLDLYYYIIIQLNKEVLNLNTGEAAHPMHPGADPKNYNSDNHDHIN